MRTTYKNLRSLIAEIWWAGKLRRSNKQGNIPPVGSWIMFNQHGPNRVAEPVMITGVSGDEVEISWGAYSYTMLVPREEIEWREDQTILSDDDPRVTDSLKKPEEPSEEAVYGGDPRKRPWGLGT